MTEKQQIEAIAQAVIWKPTTDGGVCWDANGKPIVSYPQYTRDLNAMHEAEQVLTSQQEINYVCCLGGLIMSAACENDPRWINSELSSSDSTYRATARQRAEAFLRTIGKWKD